MNILGKDVCDILGVNIGEGEEYFEAIKKVQARQVPLGTKRPAGHGSIVQALNNLTSEISRQSQLLAINLIQNQKEAIQLEVMESMAYSHLKELSDLGEKTKEELFKKLDEIKKPDPPKNVLINELSDKERPVEKGEE